MADELKAPEVTSEGVKVAVSADEWIEFERRGWTLDDSVFFEHCSHPQAFRMIVEKARDWQLKDEAGALIPFNKQELLAKFALAERGVRGQLPNISLDKQPALASAIGTAMKAVRDNPLRATS